MNKWSCFQEHGTTWTKIHLSLFYFCPWTKRSWLRNFHGRHAGSEAAEAPWSCAAWLLGDTWNRRGLTRIDGFLMGGLLVGCHVSQRWQLQKMVSSNMFSSSMPFYKKSLLLRDCDMQWNQHQCPYWLFTSRSQVGSTFYTLGSCQIKCVSRKAMIYLGPCQLPTNTNSNTQLAVLGFVFVYSGRLWY